MSTLTLARGDQMVQLWSMATLPDYQGRGYGNALLQSVLAKSKLLGVAGVGLMASPQGKRLYDKVGFESICSNPVYQVGV